MIVLTPLFPPAAGGASEDFRILTIAWSQLGIVEKILVVTERCGDSPQHERRGKIVLQRVLPARDNDPGLSARRRMVRSLITYLSLPVAIAWNLHQSGFDAVLVHGRYGKKPLLKLFKLLGLRVVVFLSDLFTPLAQLAECDAVICNSEAVFERAAAQLSAGQVYHVPLPFELPPADEQSGTTDGEISSYFLFAGNISRAKGVDILLEAFALFHKDHPEHRVFLAGPVRDSSLLREANDCVTFLGELDRTAITALMQKAAAVVLPSRSESLPRVCLEALALGTKVICPPGVPELQRALPEWTLSEITIPELLNKLEQTLRPSRTLAFDFAKHDPKKAALRIAEVCMGAKPENHLLRFA
jgi:glycosyltransferase involved in cell wall biosynthesis